jgi:hypothetical protein
VLAFRIFVMLACLIIVPMAAIFGSAFPDVVKTVLVDRLVSWTGKTTEATKTTPGGFGEYPPAVSTASSPNAWQAPPWGAQAATANAWPAQGAAQPAGGVIPANAAMSNPAMGNQSASFSTPADAGRGGQGTYSAGRGGPDSAARAGSPLQDAPAFGNPGRRGAVADPPLTPGPRGSQPLDQPERFTAMERRLREYGATYYLLETWGNEGELYRFHCKMAIGNNPNYTRHFEATDRDPLRAMAQVLERVEAWRAGRLQ